MCSIQKRDSRNSEHLLSVVGPNPAEKGTFPGLTFRNKREFNNGEMSVNIRSPKKSVSQKKNIPSDIYTMF